VSVRPNVSGHDRPGATLAASGLDTVYASLASQIDALGIGSGYFANVATDSLIIDNSNSSTTFTVEVAQRQRRS